LRLSFWGLSRPIGYTASPFVGGAAVFFAKEPSKVEIINDCNGELINFYEVVKRDFPALQKEIEISLHSRLRHRQAKVIYENPEMFDCVKRAWAVWMLACMSYNSEFGVGFGYDRKGKTSKCIDNKRAAFTPDYAVRLQRTQIECCDALRIIRSRDAQDAFFYCDPPYVGTDQGHYDGYMQEDFDALLKTLEAIDGRFLLSSFRNRSLSEFAAKNGWHTVEFRMALSLLRGDKKHRQKIEVLTANYPIVVAPEVCGNKELVSGEQT
jgi:DNA adenine methylase